MNKPKIGARQAANDIRSGMTDAELMEKYNLTAKGLESLFRKLVEAKLLEQSFVSKRTAPVEADTRPKSAPFAGPDSRIHACWTRRTIGIGPCHPPGH